MLTINVSGWKKGYGPYDLNLPFDDQKTDYQIHFKDGDRYDQASPFETETHDWNNDGDIYPQYGAWFRSQNGRGEFFTPADLLRLVQEEQAEVTGMVDPLSAINGYIKAKEEKQAAEKMSEAKSYPVSCRINGKTATVPFDTTKEDYKITLSSGQTFFQTGRFHEEYFLPDRTSVDPPVMATWFQDSSGVARFFTAKEMLELASNGRAKIDGIDIPLQQNQTKRRLADRER